MPLSTQCCCCCSSNRNHRSPVSCWTSNWKYIMTEHNRIISNLLLVQHKVSVTWRDGEFIVRRLSLRIRRVFDVVILEFDRMATWVHSRLPRRRKTVYDRLLVVTETARYSLLFKMESTLVYIAIADKHRSIITYYARTELGSLMSIWNTRNILDCNQSNYSSRSDDCSRDIWNFQDGGQSPSWTWTNWK